MAAAWAALEAARVRGTAGEHQREGAVGPGVQRGDAWGGGEAGVGLWPDQSGGRRGDAPAASKQRGRQGKGKNGLFCNF